MANALSLVWGNQQTSSVVSSTSPGSLIVPSGEWVTSIANITGTQQIQLFGTGRLILQGN